MSREKKIEIKESVKELTELMEGKPDTICKRLLLLIIIKTNKVGSVSKRNLAKVLGVDPNSVTAWKRIYEKEGIEGILRDNRGGRKKSVFSKEEHEAIKEKLNEPRNGISGYNELLKWVKSKFCKEVKYITLVKYVQRKFGAKIKVARKSHVKKDEKEVDSFKKTFQIYASSY